MPFIIAFPAPFALALLLATSLWSGSARSGELMPYSGLDETPALSLPDLSGKTVTLEAQRGQVVLVNFWASWCTPCLMEMPSMQRLLSALEDRPFTILAVNVKESREKAWRFTNLVKVRFPTLLDDDGETAKAWDVQVYPTSYVIGPEGRIRYVAYGAATWDNDEIRSAIEALMDEAEPVLHSTRRAVEP